MDFAAPAVIRPSRQSLALSAAEGSLYLVDQNLAASDGAHGELRAAAAAVRAHVAGIRALISRPIER